MAQLVQQRIVDPPLAGSNPVGHPCMRNGIWIYPEVRLLRPQLSPGATDSMWSSEGLDEGPIPSAKILECSSTGRAPALQAECCRFKSCHSNLSSVLPTAGSPSDTRVTVVRIHHGVLVLLWGCSLDGKASALHTEDRGFESRQLHVSAAR